MALDPRNIGPGEEQYKKYVSPGRRHRVQYDYRDTDGELYSTTARTLHDARALKDEWLRKKRLNTE